MEAQPLVEDTQALSHQHANGEVFAANNLETARGMCPVLGKLSLEEAGLLLELEAMGMEQVADPQQEVSQEKPTIEKIEKIQSVHHGVEKVAELVPEETISEIVPEIAVPTREVIEPTAEEVSESAASEPAEPDLHDTLMRQVEAAYTADNDSKVPEEAIAVHIEEAKPAEEMHPAESVEAAYRQADTETIAVVEPQDHLQRVEAHIPNTGEHAVHQQAEVSEEQPPIEARITAEERTVAVEPEAVAMELPQVEEAEATIEPMLFESIEEIASPDTAEPAEYAIQYSPLEADEDIPIPDSVEQDSVEYTAAEATVPDVVETDSLSEEKLVQSHQVEARPIIEVPELPAPVVQIEAAMEQVVEAIEKDETDTSEKVGAILEEIIMLPAKFEVAADENMAVLEEELQELFVELFEEASIDYSPELIESFVKLTEAHYLEELLETATDIEEETQGLPDEIGTREFLQKLQHGLNAMQQAVINFYEIGKSIVRLYAYGFEAATA